ncbi:MAG TPA: hemerythrin family protein [Treponema sp.]|nr:hemerythrin family protein [Treponema sp.]
MENILTWKDELATGFADVDLQHKKLILIINDIHVAMNEPETTYATGMAKALKRLTEYTYYHFEEEEKFMKLHDYPEFEAHHLEHQSFIEQVGKQIKTLSKANSEDGFLFYRFLGSWLINHIAKSDQAWASFVSEKTLND